MTNPTTTHSLRGKLDTQGMVCNFFSYTVTIHRPFKTSLKSVIDMDMLHLIVRACDFTYMGQIFKAIYTLAFFSFLRLSNLVPHTRNAFSPYYQLARGDVIFAPPGLLVLIKWSKTIEAKNAVKILKIPDLGANPICPVHAIRNTMSITPGASNSPFFQYKSNSQWPPLTDSQVRCHFALIPPTPSILMLSCSTSKVMAPGRPNAFENTLPQTMTPQIG